MEHGQLVPQGQILSGQGCSAGDAIDAATRAFLEELADLTPSPRDRARAKRVIDATWRLIDKAQDVLDAKAAVELPKVAEAALSALSGAEGVALGAVEVSGPGSSSGNSPASSESTPDP